MLRSECLALAAACVPGSGEVQLQQVGWGPFNDTYHARRGGGEYTLRIARAAGGEGQAAREFEAQLLARAAACDLAPPLAYSDTARGVQILGWVPGQPWEVESIGDDRHVEAAAGLIRRVHALAAPTPMRVESPARWVARYGQALAARGETVPDTLCNLANQAFQQLSILPIPASVVCHSDLHRLNILRRANRDLAGSVLLDWEYAHCSEPAWDLAGWSANNDFSAERSRALLTAYAGGSPGQSQWQRFGLLRWLFDYVCLLWIRLYGDSMPGGAPALAMRAALLETRLYAAVCGKLASSDGHYFLES